MKGRGIPLNLPLMIATMTPTKEPTTYVDIMAKYSLSGLRIRPAITAKRISPAPILPLEKIMIRTTSREYIIAERIFVNPKLILNILVYIEIG